MPIIRSPFVETIAPGAPVVLDADASGASFKLFVSSVFGTAPRDNANKGAAVSTLYVQTSGMKEPIAVASVSAFEGAAAHVRLLLPVQRGEGQVRLLVRGPSAIVIAGDQHTIMSREQVDAIGSRLDTKKTTGSA
jgi:hypothetical protein